MPRAKTQAQAYNECDASGAFIPQRATEPARSRTMLLLADEDLASINDLKTKERWNTVYKLSYDVLHTLAEALILLDGVKCTNHQCLFAYLCTKHPELELDWGFLETFRTKRNDIHYYGETITKTDYKTNELQISLYIKTLRDALKAQLH